MASRYDGKPFLRLLECYTLWAIGELTDEQSASMERLAPKLREVYKQEGSWQDVVAAAMAFPPSMPDKIREVWRKNVTRFAERGLPIDAEAFASDFADKNFVPLQSG